MSKVSYHAVEGLLIGETDVSGNQRDYLTDAVGSILHTVDQSAAKVNSYRYAPYGAFTVQANTEPIPRYCWTGESGSRSSGAAYAGQYNLARHYGKEQGAWTSQDPLWPSEWAYVYVGGEPSELD